MKKQSQTSFSQWLVMLSVPFTVLAVGGLLRLLFDHETRMAQIEANCRKPTKVVRAEPPLSQARPQLAVPQAPFVGLAYEVAGWLFPEPGKAQSQEKKE